MPSVRWEGMCNLFVDEDHEQEHFQYIMVHIFNVRFPTEFHTHHKLVRRPVDPT